MLSFIDSNKILLSHYVNFVGSATEYCMSFFDMCASLYHFIHFVASKLRKCSNFINFASYNDGNGFMVYISLNQTFCDYFNVLKIPFRKYRIKCIIRKIPLNEYIRILIDILYSNLYGYIVGVNFNY